MRKKVSFCALEKKDLKTAAMLSKAKISLVTLRLIFSNEWIAKNFVSNIYADKTENY